MLLAVVISYLSGVFGDEHSLDVKTRNALIITANGPAIWGGCVTRRKLRAVARSGFVRWYYPVLVAGLKAKTMTSLLILPALLVKVQFCIIMQDLSKG